MKKITIFNIIKQEYKLKKSILIIQILYNIIISFKPFLFICLPPLVIDYLSNNQISYSYLIIFILSILANIVDIFSLLLYIPYHTNGYILPYYFNKNNFFKMLIIDFKYSEQNESINAYNNSINYSWKCSEIAYSFISIIISSITKIILIISILVSLDIFIILFILLIVLINLYINSIRLKHNKKNSDKINELNRTIRYNSEILMSLDYGKEIRMYPKLKELFTKKYKNGYKEVESINVKNNKYNFCINMVQEILTIIQNIIIYMVMIYKYYLKQISIGAFFTYINTAKELYNTFANIFSLINELNNFKLYAESYNSFQSIPKTSYGTKNIPNQVFSIEFKNVFFTYPNTTALVLKDVSFKINKNDRTYLVGDNGSGKTTIIKLLLRFYCPDSGEILINNININEYSNDDYMKLFSVIFQDFQLFKMSIKDNICYNDYEKNKFDEIINSCGIDLILNNLPKKENTIIDRMIEKEGIELSGGERQKIAIARALYKNASIYIFDEPTSSLDPSSEYEILQLYSKLIQGKTSIIISHRLSVASVCNNIIVIDKGKIIEQGEFKELISNKKLFYKKYKLQSKHYVS